MAWTTKETELIHDLLRKGLRGKELAKHFPKKAYQYVWYKQTRSLIELGLPKEPEPQEKQTFPAFSMPQIPAGELTAEEILEYKCRQFNAKDGRDRATSLIPVQIHTTGPVCVAFFGDPHLDDDGCNIPQLRADIASCKDRDYVYPMCIGDYTNNWVGRLQSLYAHQTTTITQAHRLIEWFFAQLPWLLAVGGNHDHWSGKLDKAASTAATLNVLYSMHGQRLALHLENSNVVRVNARHDHKGHSQFHPTHGPMKTAFFGERDHIYVSGHIHTDGYISQKVAGLRTHAIRVGTYKRFDDYGKQNQFMDCSTPSSAVVIQPQYRETDDRFITYFASLSQAVEYTEMLRQIAV